MIHDLFPTKVLIKDIELTEKDATDLEVAISAIFTAHEAKSGSHVDSGEDSMPLFNEYNIKVFPVLQKLKDLFIDGFVELGLAYEGNTKQEDTREKIAEMVDNHAGRLPLMRNGDYKQIHSHPGNVAFGIFYLTDVDNEKDGGYLVLRDPSFNTTPVYGGQQTCKIKTKAGRLIIAPTHVWHEVTPYHGKEDRVTVVSNLCYMPERYTDIFG